MRNIKIVGGQKKESSDYITHKRQSELFAVKNTFGI